MFCSVSEKRGMHEFAYFSIGGLPTKSGSTASAASQYSLRGFTDSLRGDQPHSGQRMRGGSSSPAFLSSSNSWSITTDELATRFSILSRCLLAGGFREFGTHLQ